MLPNGPQHQNGNNRRYSLFSGSSLSQSAIGPLLNRNASKDDNNLAASSGRGNFAPTRRFLTNFNSSTISMAPHLSASSQVICQKCKRFEVDLTNTSDDLNAIDGELKASRQVISLLQRQLELFRIEKEGLEKLIVSQSNNCPKKQQEGDDGQTLERPTELRDATINTTTTTTTMEDNEKRLLNLIQEQLYAKDEEIVKLKFNLKESQNINEQLKLQIHTLEEDVGKLKGENLILNENLKLRDQTIVSLSNELFEQSNGNVMELYDGQQDNATLTNSISSSLRQFGESNSQQKQVAKLIDTIDAYKKTNELLSNNVISLNDKCAEAERREIETKSQCQELEAKCCQIQSKLLSLLKEIEQSSKQHLQEAGNNLGDGGDNATTSASSNVICSDSVKILIKRLLEDKSLDIPLSWKEGNSKGGASGRDNANKSEGCGKQKSASKYECDELGFYIDTYDDDDDGEQIGQAVSRATLSNNSSPSRTNRNNSIDSTASKSRLPTVEEAIEASEQQQQKQKQASHYYDDTKEIIDGKRMVTMNRHLSIDSSKSDESRWHLKWDYFIKDFDKIDLLKSKEFKLLLRSGVPQEYRCKVWKSLINMHIGKDRENYGPDYYQSLLLPKPIKQTATSKTTTAEGGTNATESLAKKSHHQINPSSKQIELDLLRTLPNNRHFETLDSSGTVRLRRVLTAYSEHNPKVGYCQGMNRLAAVALLVLPEEEAFWCLATIVDKIMPNGYYNDLWLAQVDSSVVMDFVAIKMPNLSEHFKRHNVDLSLFAWFLTIFVDGTPPALFLRLWDCFLYEGDKILFRVALALLKMYQSHLMRLNNSVAINNYLRSTVNEPMNIDQFFEIAFEWINPLSTRTLKIKRMHNLQLIKAGFENFNKSFSTPTKIDDSDDDDEDDDNHNDDSEKSKDKNSLLCDDESSFISV